MTHQNESSRRGFIGSVASGAAAIGLAAMINPFKAAASAGVPFSPDPNVENWFKSVKGKHRILFDAPEYNGGMPLAFPRVFQITNNNSGVGNEDLGIVVVLRHNAIPLALDNSLWEKYKLGEMFNITDLATGKPSLRNFFWQPKQGELEIPGMAINELQETGVLFCACAMAVFHYSGVIAKKTGQEHETVRKEWMAGMLKGIQPAPSGVFAVNRLQESGCSYCFAG